MSGMCYCARVPPGAPHDRRVSAFANGLEQAGFALAVVSHPSGPSAGQPCNVRLDQGGPERLSALAQKLLGT